MARLSAGRIRHTSSSRISIEFAGRAAYDSYNEHPDHVRFVQERWIPEVADFLEVDYEAAS